MAKNECRRLKRVETERKRPKTDMTTEKDQSNEFLAHSNIREATDVRKESHTLKTHMIKESKMTQLYVNRSKIFNFIYLISKLIFLLLFIFMKKQKRKHISPAKECRQEEKPIVYSSIRRHYSSSSPGSDSDADDSGHKAHRRRY